MKVTLKQLRVFVQAAKQPSLSKAAEACFITQAAASLSLQQLEKAIGKALFDRIGKRLQLNSNGEAMLAQAINILDQTVELEQSLANSEGKLCGSLTIGASTTIANYILPKYIAKFKQIHPDVEFNVTIANTETITAQVASLTMDMGFIEGINSHPNITASVWAKDELKVICSKNHPLAKKSNITKADLLDYQWVIREPGSGSRQIFDNAMGLTDQPIAEAVLASSEAIKCYVANSSCLGYVSKAILNGLTKDDAIQCIEVKGLELQRHFYQLAGKNKYQTQLSRAFTEFLSKTSS